MHFFQKTSPFYQLLKLYISIGVIIRIILLFHPITSASFSWGGNC